MGSLIGIFSPVHGSVSVLVRGTDDTRSVQYLNLASGVHEVRTDINASEFAAENIKIFALSDGTYITLSSAGIVRKNDTDGSESLLVATPVAPVMARTPLAVWGDGLRIAWVNPADHSLQVFAKNARGAYLPIFASGNVIANSVLFTEAGDTVVLTRIANDETEVFAIDLASGQMTRVKTMQGFATLLP